MPSFRTLSILMIHFSFSAANLSLPRIAMAHGPLHEQIAEMTKLIAQFPDSAELYLWRGELYRHHLDWPEALADYQLADRLNPNLAAVHLCRGKMFFDADRLDEAKAALDKFLARKPDDGEGMLTRARVLAGLGKQLQAAQEYTVAIEHLPIPHPEYFLERAQAFAGAGADHAEAALRSIDEGIQRLGPLVTLQLFAIDLEIARRQFDAALSRLDLIIAQSARKEKWLCRRGEILRMAGRLEEARLVFASAIKEIEALPVSRRRTKAIAELEKRLRAEH